MSGRGKAWGCKAGGCGEVQVRMCEVGLGGWVGLGWGGVHAMVG